MGLDIDPKTGAVIVTPVVPVLTIPPVTSISKPDFVASDETKEVPDVNSGLTRKEAVLNEMNRIEKEAGGISNIGMTSNYWELQKEYRSLS